MSKKLKAIFIGTILFFSPFFVKADYLGQKTNFYIDEGYDLQKRTQLAATLQKVTDKLYFYIEDEWWNSLNNQSRDDLAHALNNLSSEFEQNIYPVLTSNFGSEWKPGIDKDEKITILIHSMLGEAGGYINTRDEYSRPQSPKSNEREMIYLNASRIRSSLNKSFLAHEFTHLIGFYQKSKYGKEEEIWLDEARSEYAISLLGYDNDYSGSNIEQRIKNFSAKPTNSLTEWQNTTDDYGVANIFIQYLVDHYGKRVLTDSLQSEKIGIPSINDVLKKSGFSEDFSQIFTNWTITVLVNDCGLGEKYCYLNPNLKKIKIVPQTNFLPLFGESSLYILNDTKEWSGSWHKIIGGKGDLTFEFDGDDAVNFRVVYLACNREDKCSVSTLSLDLLQKGSFFLPRFDEDYNFVTVIPLLMDKISGFDGAESRYFFSWKASTAESAQAKEEKLIKELQARIEFLKKQIAETQAKINEILAKKSQSSCSQFNNDLYLGLSNSNEVKCLQEFLKSQGSEIYPEGLITGSFLALTQQAVIQFQEKYASEILAPLGLTKGTGYVGLKTRLKINQLLTNKP